MMRGYQVLAFSMCVFGKVLAAPGSSVRVRNSNLRGGGAQRLGEYGEVDTAAQERVLKSHLAPTLRMFELVDQDHNGHLGIDKVAAAEQELEKRHEELSKMPLRNLRLIFRPHQRSACQPKGCVLCSENPDPKTWTAWLVGNWSDWLEAHDASWDATEEVFGFNVSIPVGQSEFKFVVNDHWVTCSEYKVVGDHLGTGDNNVVTVAPPSVEDIARNPTPSLSRQRSADLRYAYQRAR
jgi:hypothetical protein